MKLFNNLKHIIFGLSFGLKDANDKMFTTTSSSSETNGIAQQLETNRLSQALKQGEVTQEVKELRYRTYMISEESKKYKYIGNGQVVLNTPIEKSDIEKSDIEKSDIEKSDIEKSDIEKSDIENKDEYKIEIIQENFTLTSSVLDGLNSVGKSFIPVDYTIKLTREDIPRIKMEAFIQKVVIKEINDNDKQLEIYVSKYIDPINRLSRIFINEIVKIKDNLIKPDILELLTLSFITNKAYGKRDLLKYSYNNIKFIKIDEYNGSYVIKYNATVLIDGEDLLLPLHDSVMENKYMTKEKKNIEFDATQIFTNDESVLCDVCHQPANKYDYAITKDTYGKGMCQECFKKYLYENNK
jgi:hypothetical protein